MIVHRFMSRAEFERLMDGKQLVNESRHKGFRSESRGFCFTTEFSSIPGIKATQALMHALGYRRNH